MTQPNNESGLPVQAATAQTTTGQTTTGQTTTATIQIENQREAYSLLGAGDANLRRMRELTKAKLVARGETITITLLEGKTDKQKNPHPKGSLAYAAWVFARLGGWTGYYGKPGPIVMLRGLTQFHAIKHGWSFRNV